MPSSSRRTFLLTTASVGIGSLAGCFSQSCSPGRSQHNSDISLSDDVQWPTQYHDAANTSYNPSANGPTGDVQLAWRYTTCNPTEVSAAISNGDAYFENQIINAQTGESTDEWGDTNSTPTLANGTAYVHSSDLEARDPTTGEIQWAYSIANTSNTTSSTVHDGTVYVVENSLFAVNSETGEERWTFGRPLDLQTPPAVRNQTVFLTTPDWTLYAVDTETGEERWNIQPDGGNGLAPPPAVANDLVYIIAEWETGTIQAVDPSDGSVAWTATTGMQIANKPAVTEASVFAVGNNDEGGAIVALNAETGERQWARTLGNESLVTVTASNETVYTGPEFANEDIPVYALDHVTGEDRWQFEVRSRDFGDYSESTLTGITVVDDYVFAVTSGGEVHAIMGQS